MLYVYIQVTRPLWGIFLTHTNIHPEGPGHANTGDQNTQEDHVIKDLSAGAAPGARKETWKGGEPPGPSDHLGVLVGGSPAHYSPGSPDTQKSGSGWFHMCHLGPYSLSSSLYLGRSVDLEWHVWLSGFVQGWRLIPPKVDWTFRSSMWCFLSVDLHRTRPSTQPSVRSRHHPDY